MMRWQSLINFEIFEVHHVIYLPELQLIKIVYKPDVSKISELLTRPPVNFYFYGLMFYNSTDISSLPKQCKARLIL